MIRLDTFVKLVYVELVAVLSSERIVLHVSLNIFHKVVHSPAFNTRGCCPYKLASHVFINHVHNSVRRNPIVQRYYLNTACFTCLWYVLFIKIANPVTTVGNLFCQFFNDLLFMRKEILPGSGIFPVCAG